VPPSRLQPYQLPFAVTGEGEPPSLAPSYVEERFIFKGLDKKARKYNLHIIFIKRLFLITI